MTPWRYLAASGPETEISFRDASGAIPEGAGPVGSEPMPAGAAVVVRVRRREVDWEMQPRHTNGVVALVRANALRAGCMMLRGLCVAVDDATAG